MEKTKRTTDKCGCTFDHTEHGSYLIGQPVCDFHKRESQYGTVDGVTYSMDDINETWASEQQEYLEQKQGEPQ